MTLKIEQYCSVCKAVLEMTVVPTADGDEDGVLWLRCPRCHGFLPKISDSLGDQSPPATDEPSLDKPETDPGAGVDPGPEAPRVDQGVAAMADSFPDFDPEAAVSYRPWGRYEIGAVIHHLAWDDYGVVQAKETLAGGRRAVQVRFEKAGVVRLIEESDEVS